MNLKKDNIIKHVKKIRKEIGHEDSEINIQKLIFNEKNKELWIITPDRPDKSAIIGKGGWVVGRLREETGLNKIHVESYSDFLLKEYRMKLSLESINSFIKENSPNNSIDNLTNNQKKPIFIKPMKSLKSLLEEKIENIFSFNIENYFVEIDNESEESDENNEYNEYDKYNKYDKYDKNDKNNENNDKNQHKAIVALSGGVDSSFSLILAKKLGFNPLAITIDPGTIILPKQFKDNIEKLCNAINVDHKYIDMDYNEIIKDSLDGRFHPCGRCSSMTETTVFDYAADNDISIVIFGDMLSTGLRCITKHMINTKNNKNNKINNINKTNRINRINKINKNDTNGKNSTNNAKEIYRLNLPATISIGKQEMKNMVFKYNLEKIKGFGCPLLYETHKKYPYLRKFSIQRILRETRSGALEPGEALDLIWSFYRLK